MFDDRHGAGMLLDQIDFLEQRIAALSARAARLAAAATQPGVVADGPRLLPAARLATGLAPETAGSGRSGDT